MLRKVISSALLNNNLSIVRRTASTASKNEKWDLFSGVLIERLPVLTKSLTPIELEFQTMLSDLELEQSLKSDHELRHEKEKRHADLLKKGDTEMDVDIDVISKQTAQDMEDAYIDEFNQFKLAERITKADKTNDTKSLNRKLEENLFLLVEQKLGNQNLFLLPQSKRLDGETMRQAAERALKEACGDQLNVLFYGNAPCGFYKYKYPADQRKEAVGAKIFFFRTAFQNGSVKETNYEWLDKSDLGKKLNQKYFESVSQFLL